MGNFINEKAMPLIDKFTNSRIIKILMNGFMGVAALTIGGSLFAMLRSLPLGDWYTNFLISTGLFDILNFPIMITSDLISLYLVLSFGYFAAKSYDKNPGRVPDPDALRDDGHIDGRGRHIGYRGGFRRASNRFLWRDRYFPVHDRGNRSRTHLCLVP